MPVISDAKYKEYGKNYAWFILTNLLAAQLVMSVGAYAWGPLAPFFREGIGASRAEIGMITSALFFTATITAIPSGILVDKLGAYIMLVICLTIMGFFFVIIPLANKIKWIIFFAGLSGFGYGIINQVSAKGVMHWFTARARATAMGIKQSGVTIGGALAAFLLPVLTTFCGWKKTVLSVGIVMLLTAFFSSIFYKERPEASNLSSSKTGKTKHKISLFKILADPALLTIILILPFLAFSQISISTFLVLYLKEEQNFSVSIAASCLTAAMTAGALGRVSWGIISDRIFDGNRLIPLFILSIIGCISVFSFAFLQADAPKYLYFILSALIGFTLIGWNAVLLTVVAEFAGTQSAGSVMGIVTTTGWLGMVTGPTIFGFIADLINYFTGWLFVASSSFISAVGFFYIFMRMKRRLRKV